MPVDPTGDITDTANGWRHGPRRRPLSRGPAEDPVRVQRYRVAAFVVGWGLLILCAAMVLKYVFGMGAAVAIWGPIHGALFVVYVIIAFDLAYKDRWSPLGTLWVLIAGTIPFVSFFAERQVQRKVLARQKMTADSGRAGRPQSTRDHVPQRFSETCKSPDRWSRPCRRRWRSRCRPDPCAPSKQMSLTPEPG